MTSAAVLGLTTRRRWAAPVLTAFETFCHDAAVLPRMRGKTVKPELQR